MKENAQLEEKLTILKHIAGKYGSDTKEYTAIKEASLALVFSYCEEVHRKFLVFSATTGDCGPTISTAEQGQTEVNTKNARSEYPKK